VDKNVEMELSDARQAQARGVVLISVVGGGS